MLVFRHAFLSVLLTLTALLLLNACGPGEVSTTATAAPTISSQPASSSSSGATATSLKVVATGGGLRLPVVPRRHRDRGRHGGKLFHDNGRRLLRGHQQHAGQSHQQRGHPHCPCGPGDHRSTAGRHPHQRQKRRAVGSRHRRRPELPMVSQQHRDVWRQQPQPERERRRQLLRGGVLVAHGCQVGHEQHGQREPEQQRHSTHTHQLPRLENRHRSQPGGVCQRHKY